MKHVLKHVFDPKIIIPTLLSAALLVFALTGAGPGQVGTCLTQALAGAWLAALLLAAVYLEVKLVQWRIYLGRLGWKVRAEENKRQERAFSWPRMAY